MNTLNKLTQTLKQWHKDSQEQGIINRLFRVKALKKVQHKSYQMTYDLNQKIFSSRSSYTLHPPLMLGLAILSLTSIVGYRYYNQPQLAVGTESPRTIYAPSDGSFEDPKTTEEKRRAAETSIQPILKRDPSKTIELRVEVNQILDQIQQLRTSSGNFPFVAETLLPFEAQRYLRTTTDQEWKILLTQVNAPESSSDLEKPDNSLLATIITSLRKEKEKVSEEVFKERLDKIEQARQKYQTFLAVLPNSALNSLTKPQILRFVNLTDTQWEQTKEKTQEAVHRILTQGISQGIPPSLLQETIDVQLSQSFPTSVKPTIQTLLITLLEGQANLVTDETATRSIAQQASAAIEPQLVEIKQGEIIVKAGETISQEAFVLLDGFHLSERSINWLGLAKSGILVTGGVVIFCLVAGRVKASLRRRDHILLWLLSATTPALAIINPSYLNLPMIGVLTSSFYNPTLAVTQVLILGGLSGFADETPQWDYLIAGMAGGVLAAGMAGRLRSRDELAFLGAGVGMIQGSVYLLYHLTINAASGGIGYLLWYLLLPQALLYGAYGMIWTMLAIGLSPYLERLFDLVTPIRLVELSNPNCALLKRLQTEAPGTFQHTLFVACLAEAAARELNCNVELVRAGTLYHDIGKMHDPMGFIENQMGGPNKHDEIDDPWVSVDIIKKHVSEGLVMAKQYGLPKMIQAFIPEHQGKLLISYFYYQAKQQAEAEGKEPIEEEDFRYIGPIPQTRETGIVMLADGCEAALRSLQDATPDDALSLIKKIFKARWRDGQLKDSGLKYEELPMIADIFVRVWQQFHHKRIAYPKAALDTKA